MIHLSKSEECWWSKVIQTKEFKEIKGNWKNLAQSEDARESEAQRLRQIYESCAYTGKEGEFKYSAPFGEVQNVPGNFSMWMSGVALIASYLTEKKQVKGLYVCETLEALSARICQVDSSLEDQRFAFIVGTFPSSDECGPNYPQHKVVVCVEKKEGQLTIALLDAAPEPNLNDEIIPESFTEDIWDRWYIEDEFNCQELVYRAIMNACRHSKSQVRLLHSQVLRQKDFGCEVFALQDALAYLRDPDFFSKIKCSEELTVTIDDKYEIEVITALPPQYMVGTQSAKMINEYRKCGGDFDTMLDGKKKSLQNYLDANQVEVKKDDTTKIQNHYITKKTFKYLNFAVLSLKELGRAEIEKVVNRTLIRL